MPGKAHNINLLLGRLGELYRKYLGDLDEDEMDALMTHMTYPEDVTAGQMKRLEDVIQAGPRTPEQLRVYRGSGMEEAPVYERRLHAYPMATSLNPKVAKSFGHVEALTVPEGSPGLLLMPETTDDKFKELFEMSTYWDQPYGEAEFLLPIVEPGGTKPAEFYRHPRFEGDELREYTYRPPYKARGGLAQVGDRM
jgi:hypothetical protein